MTRRLFCLLLLPLLSLLPAAADSQGDSNLLVNPSFEMEGEASVGKIPPHWTRDTLSQGDVRRSPDTKSTVVVASGGHTGKYKAGMRLGESDKWIHLKRARARRSLRGATDPRTRRSAWQLDNPRNRCVTTGASGEIAFHVQFAERES